ncbi:MAG TPA: ABC transporter permease subunit [Ktedonosporobacter sp.]|nr:ABC transporter permease subunit [Ktedonosporobacter sp.]
MLTKSQNLPPKAERRTSLAPPVRRADLGKHRQASLRSLKKSAPLLLMAAPGLLFLLIFAYLPMFGLIIAFKDYRAYQGILGSAWVGLQNFRFLFSTQDAWHITSNTLLMNALFIVTSLVASLAIALMLNEVRDTSKILSRFYQSTLFFPYFLSWVIVGYFVFALLNTNSGMVDKILVQFGLPSIDWYGSPQYWPVILVLVNLWKNAGFWSIVYLAGMVAINPEYYEAAEMDGASKWQQIRSITLPLIMPLIIINVLLSIGRIFYADFGLFFQVTHDSSRLYSATDVIDTYVYRALTTLGDVGMSSAAGFYQSVVGFILVVLSNWIVRRVDPDKALF